MEDLQFELDMIKKVLDASKEYDLQTEVMHSILSFMKEDNSLSITEATQKGIMYFKHLITIEE